MWLLYLLHNRQDLCNWALRCCYCVQCECHRLCNVNKSLCQREALEWRWGGVEMATATLVWMNVCPDLLKCSVMSRKRTISCLYVFFSQMYRHEMQKWKKRSGAWTQLWLYSTRNLNKLVCGRLPRRPDAASAGSSSSLRGSLTPSPPGWAGLWTQHPANAPAGRRQGLQRSHHKASCAIIWWHPGVASNNPAVLQPSSFASIQTQNPLVNQMNKTIKLSLTVAISFYWINYSQ